MTLQTPSTVSASPVPAPAAPAVRLHTRPVDLRARQTLLQAGVDPLMARLLAARGIRHPDELKLDLGALLPPDALLGLPAAVARISTAIDDHEPILIVGDYDCDGATAIALAVEGLRMLGATVDYLVPNRFENGYGLTPEVVDAALVHPRLGRPALLVTVDNGIASVAGVEHANSLGLPVIVTDHHLPAETLPAALAIVNPNQPGCPFPDKNLAGVGVMLYVLIALRSHRRQLGRFEGAPPSLSPLLDLAALGTVADVVPLTHNNRVIVNAGLSRIRAGGHGRASPRCCRWRAVRGQPSTPWTWALPSVRASMQPGAWPTWASAWNACWRPTWRVPRSWPPRWTRSTGSGATSRAACAKRPCR